MSGSSLESSPVPPTDHQHTLRIARKSEIELHRMLEQLPAAAYTCDTHGHITYFNQRAVALWGRAPRLNQIEDCYCGSLKMYAADGVAIRHEDCVVAQALRTSTGHLSEVIIEQPDGRRVPVLAHGSPIRDAAGDVIGAVGILVDINERKLAEARLREAAQQKDRFLATVAHELRNPLAPIGNALQILKLENAISPQAQSALEIIERQLQQLTRLVSDLVDASRTNSNKLNLHRVRVKLADIVWNAVETARPLISARGHQLVIQLPDYPIYVDADAARLTQALVNLLNNAAKYTDTDGHILLSLARHNANVVITVHDNGTGIPTEMLSKIFDMYAQAHQSLEQSRDGLGIGLALVKQIVSLHDGTIEAKSPGRGEGSEFIIRLPIATDVATEPTIERTVPASAPLRILLVDDNPDSVASLSAVLKRMGNDVRTAGDCVEAVGHVRSFHPHVALIDLGMPGVDGFDTARLIRELPSGKNMTLIAITGWGRADDQAKSGAAGFDQHLVKPVAASSLSLILSSVRASEGIDAG